MSAADPRTGSRHALKGKVLRYGASSVVATVCSEVTFLLLYGVANTSTTVASLLAWLAGAGPNYWMNRSWAWGRRGRPSLRREVLPYLAIILVTLGLAVVATGAASSALHSTQVSDLARTVLVGGVFLLVYVVVFILRFLLLDRLFANPSSGPPDRDS